VRQRPAHGLGHCAQYAWHLRVRGLVHSPSRARARRRLGRGSSTEAHLDRRGHPPAMAPVCGSSVSTQASTSASTAASFTSAASPLALVLDMVPLAALASALAAFFALR